MNIKAEPPIMRILDALVSAALVVAIAIASWALTATIDLRERVAVIESNRITKEEVARRDEVVRAEFVDGIDDIKRCLNLIQRNKQCDF